MALCHDLLRGAIDLHTHSAPSLFPRLLDDVGLAEQARAAGMRAVLLKAHEQETTGRAALVRKAVPGVEAFGGIVLNQIAGGLNPHAVDAALKLGARMVWMPTISAQHHLDHYGGGHYGGAMRPKAAPRPVERGLTVLDDHGALRPEAGEILGEIAEADVCLSTGHLGLAEIRVLVREARRAGVKKLLITHPDLALSAIPPEEQKALADEGAIIEKDMNTLTPPWTSVGLEALVKSIREIGPARCVLATDYGQLHSPAPAEGLRVFIQLCLEQGLTAEEVRTMVAVNPARLLGLE